MKSTIVAKDKAQLITIIDKTIEQEGNECDLNFIDTSNIMDMSNLFYQFPNFNGNISKWNTVNVNDMSYMFSQSQFNDDISKWNTSNLEYIGNMFRDSPFNGDLSKWNV